jgi:hypothetical protein
MKENFISRENLEHGLRKTLMNSKSPIGGVPTLLAELMEYLDSTGLTSLSEGFILECNKRGHTRIEIGTFSLKSFKIPTKTLDRERQIDCLDSLKDGDFIIVSKWLGCCCENSQKDACEGLAVLPNGSGRCATQAPMLKASLCPSQKGLSEVGSKSLEGTATAAQTPIKPSSCIHCKNCKSGKINRDDEESSNICTFDKHNTREIDSFDLVERRPEWCPLNKTKTLEKAGDSQ